jgi:hypothetical protein
MIGSAIRFGRLLRSRGQDYRGLVEAEHVAEVGRWAEQHRLLGFNNSPLRARVVQELVSACGVTHFIETGTHHGATAVAARRLLKVPVHSCELLKINHAIAKITTAKIDGIRVEREDSRVFLHRVAEELQTWPAPLPLYYLDAHEGVGPWNCPLPEELETVLSMSHQCLVLIDDFEVPDGDFRPGCTYGSDLQLTLDCIGGLLGRWGVTTVWFPTYSATLESEPNARAGYAVFAKPDSIIEESMPAGPFPWNLMRPYTLSGEQLRAAPEMPQR